ncbi:MAG TPA: helix-turn-helix domain-containing protein [Polyangiaceae bacterium]
MKPPSEQVIAGLVARDLLTTVAIICARRGITVHDLCSPTRTKAVSYARHEIWWTLRCHPHRHYSYFEIARLFGFDHSSVFYGVAAHLRRIEDPL